MNFTSTRRKSSLEWLPETLFQQPWMIEAASLGQWQEVTVERNGDVVARLPFVINKRFGTTTITKPYYCRVGGPSLLLPRQLRTSRQVEHITLLIRELSDKLPPHDRFHTTLPPDTSLALPYMLAGFSMRLEYTFRIPATTTLDALLADMKGAARRNIVTTFDRLTVQRHDDLDRFLALAREMTAKDATRYRYDEIKSIFEAAHSRNQVVIVTASDEHNTNMGTSILLYDDHVVYFWLTARKVVRGNRAYSRLVWEAFKFATETGRDLDLDGYPSVAGAQFLANLGADPVVRPNVLHTNLRFDGVHLLRGGLRAGKAAIDGLRQNGDAANAPP
jgi:hypothetical protein